MTSRCITILVLVIFIMLAVFGLYLPSHAGHHGGCPFALGEMAVCASSLVHLSHWQSALMAIVAELLVLISAATVLLFGIRVQSVLHPSSERYRLRQRTPRRPTLLQELYARGILNRKELFAPAYITC